MRLYCMAKCPVLLAFFKTALHANVGGDAELGLAINSNCQYKGKRKYGEPFEQRMNLITMLPNICCV